MFSAVAEPYQTAPFEVPLQLRASKRIRHSPLTQAAAAKGATAWSVYNHMLLPVGFNGVEDYHHLKRAVQVWDVCAERQVELSGPDAAKLAQAMTPRNVADLPVLKCAYAPCCDRAGGLVNDPLVLRPDENRWWFSIADTDLLLFAEGIAAGMGLSVTITEPDVHPVAVQGPRSRELMERLFGREVGELKFFGAGVFAHDGAHYVIARSGWSGQGGYEIFVEGWDRCEPLWDALFAAGQDLDVGPGGPNGIERIEAGLLSHGNDMTVLDNPFECGLGKYVDLDAPSLARDALRNLTEPSRRLRGLVFERADLPTLSMAWRVSANGRTVGDVRSAANSPDHGAGIAIAMLDVEAEVGSTVQVAVPGSNACSAEVRDLPLKP